VQEQSGASPLRAAGVHDRVTAANTTLCFGLLEVLRSPRHALDLRLLSVQIVALAPGYVVYFFFAYSSLLLSGHSLAAVWASWGLLPCLVAANGTPSIVAWIFFGLGVAILAAAFLLANAAGSRMLWMKWRGNVAYSVREAYDFALGKVSAIVMAPLSIILLSVGILAAGSLIGLMGRIPYIGELTVAGFAWLWLLAAMATLLFLVIAGVVFIFAPAIVATTGADALEVIFQATGISWRRPGRFLIYLIGVISAASVGLIVLAFFAKCAFLLMDGLLANTMGSDYQKLSTQAQYLLQSWSAGTNQRLVAAAPSLISPFFFSRMITPLELSPWFDALAHIFALSLLFSAMWILAYPLAIMNSGLMLAYLTIREAKDEEKTISNKAPFREKPSSGDKIFSGETL
jgi:hypothetical protein